MIQAMYNGVSGLRAHKTMMDVISNNIANINTVGFKSSRVSFKEMFNQTVKGATAAKSGKIGGTNPEQIGLGVTVGSIDVTNNQGSLQPTGKVTDMAIEGSGYFIVGDGSGRFYTRDGSFSIDSDGYLVTAGSGLKVMGWTADKITGTIDSTTPVVANSFISLPVGQIARQTTKINYGGNLNSSTAAGETTTVSNMVYDTLGTEHQLAVAFTKSQSPVVSQGFADTDTTTVGTGSVSIVVGRGSTTEQTYNVSVPAGSTLDDLATAIEAIGGVGCSIADAGAGAGADRYSLRLVSASGQQAEVTSSLTGGAQSPTFSRSSENAGVWSWQATEGGLSVGSGSVVFDGSGKSPFASGEISIPLTNGASTPLISTLDFSAISQLSGDTTLSATSQNGLPMGMLDSFTVGQDGVISGVFTNGTSQPLAQIALTAFSNPAGLTKVGNNLLVESSNSGLPQISIPAVGSMGKINAGFLESSNVDLPTEFANMIVAQRGFQANSRIITTSDEILQELVQLTR
jgi:flagellar hook protein FlgE